MTVRTGPTSRDARGVPAGFDRDDVGTDSAHSQRRGDPGLDVSGVHRAVEQQDVDKLPGPVRVTIDPAGGSPERLMGGRERPGLPRQGKRRGAGQRPADA